MVGSQEDIGGCRMFAGAFMMGCVKWGVGRGRGVFHPCPYMSCANSGAFGCVVLLNRVRRIGVLKRFW
jgi:hypothetical protein